MKKLFILTNLALISSLCSCGTPVPKVVDLTLSSLASVETIHTEKQLEFITSEDPDSLVNGDKTYGKTSNSFAKEFNFTWSETNDLNVDPTYYELCFKEKGSEEGFVYQIQNEKSVKVSNFKINTTYEYYLNSVHGDTKFKSEVKEFTVTDLAPRNLFIEGVENCRDLGGWDIGEGKTYKQGMIYRTAQFNYGGVLNTYKCEPTDKGLYALNNVLKIKTDIDLRKTEAFNGQDEVNGITSSPLGSSVKYVSCPMNYGNQNIFTQDINKESIRLFFDTLSNEANYPIAFHCMRGTDRTGALAYVIGALLGMNEEDLMLDYLFSDLANINNPVREATITGEDFYIQGIKNSVGDSLKEKTRNYLINTVNVSEDTLNRIINILSE